MTDPAHDTGQVAPGDVRRSIHFTVELADSLGPHHAEPEQPRSTERPPKLLFDAREGGELVGVHANTIYEAAKRGDLACQRIGRLLRFSQEDLLDWGRGR